MQIQIEAFDLPGHSCAAAPGFPGYTGIHVAVQHRDRSRELLDPQPGDAVSATWTLQCTATATPSGIDLKGPYVQGRPEGRFIYLSWSSVDEAGALTLFRRAKLMLDAVDQATAEAATRSGLLLARLRLTDAKGQPLCAAVRPPLIEWIAGQAQ
ncbi:DUF5990 family protein [Streptosporangium sp. 'caverna']|uniref:DUF5990 family protein n=1 Tax=Streptosporangium sp. 'caverna' TaxID=2202249 RepID=UPI000D7D7E1B|nr:DUF5990 family protein [Streptosporangium sp. 'caverna']AWS43783.1 monooxygenase [Streptosporangium sp. 'caverna']